MRLNRSARARAHTVAKANTPPIPLTDITRQIFQARVQEAQSKKGQAATLMTATIA